MVRCFSGMQELEKKSPFAEGLKTGVADGLASLLLFVGPAVKGMASGAALARWQNRATEAVYTLEDRISALEGRVSRDFLRSDEFEDLFADTLAEAARLESEDRRELYGSVLVSAAMQGPGSQVVAKRMIRRIEALNPIHFYFLKELAKPSHKGHGSGGTTQVRAYLTTLFDDIIGDMKQRDQSADLVSDLQAEGHLIPEAADRLESSRRDFGVREARNWISRKGWETLIYLWPEDGEIADLAKVSRNSPSI